MSNFRDIPTGLNIPTQVPLDKKLWYEDISNVVLGTSGYLAYSFYKGMRAFVANQRVFIEWREVEPSTPNKVLGVDFTYPNGLIVNDVDYSNKTYNFVIINDLADYYTKEQIEDLIEDFITIEDIPEVEVPVYTMKNIDSQLPNTVGLYYQTTTLGIDKTFEVKRLTSDNLLITEVNGVVTINTPEDTNMKSFYVNTQYTGTTSDGTILRPFKTFDEAVVAFKGTGTNALPEFRNRGRIILLTSAITANPINVNYLNIEGGGNILTYTGTTNYWYNSETLKTAVGVDAQGRLNTDVTATLLNLRVVSTAVGGILKCVGYKSPTVSTAQSGSYLTLTNVAVEDSSHLNFASQYAVLTNELGQTITAYGSPVYGELTSTTNTPVVDFSSVNWTGEGGARANNLEVYGCRNSLMFLNKTTFIVTGTLKMSYNNFYLSLRPKVSNLFLPKPSLSYIKCIDSYFRTEQFIENNTYAIMHTVQQRVTPTADNFFDIVTSKDGVGIDYSTFVIYSGIVGGVINNRFAFVSTDSTVELLDIKTLSSRSNIEAFGVNTVGANIKQVGDIHISGSTFNNVKENARLKVSATEASVNGFQFSSASSFPDNASAITAGLIKGNIYFNTTTNSLTKII